MSTIGLFKKEYIETGSRMFRNRSSGESAAHEGDASVGTMTPPPMPTRHVVENTHSGVHAILSPENLARTAPSEEPRILYPATDSNRQSSGLVPAVTQPQTAAQDRARAQAAAAARLGNARWGRPNRSDALTPTPAARQTGASVAQPAVAPSQDARATQSIKAVPAEASPSTSALRRAVGAAVRERLPAAARPSPDHIELADTGFDSEAFCLAGDPRPRRMSELTLIVQGSAEEYMKEWLPRFRQEIYGDARKPLTWADLPAVREKVGVGNLPDLSAWYVRIGDQFYSAAEYALGLHKALPKGRSFEVLRGGPQMYYVDPETSLLYTEAQRQAAQQPAKTGFFGLTTHLFNRR